jgi:peptidoglycan-N-acetylglucosamine deacetylase
VAKPFPKSLGWMLVTPFVAMSAVAFAQGEATHQLTPAQQLPACASDPDKLGVSRIVEIDAAGGPRFGHLQYKDQDPLADKEVVLTFDDGPARRFTQPILDAMTEECTLSTFFMVGRMALSDPEMVKETAKRGHTIATHSWSHKRLYQIGTAKGRDEIELGISAIAHALGAPPAPFFRFPYLGDTAALRSHLESRNQGAFSIDVDARDFNTRSPAVVRSRVMAQLKAKGKGIILFHDIQPSTAGALPNLLDDLRKGGYKVVHFVAKAPSVTLPEYDALADKEARRRTAVLAKQPLADRSVVWPESSGKAAIPASAEPEELPWQPKKPAGQTPAAREPTPAAKPVLRPSVEDNWSINPLGR